VVKTVKIFQGVKTIEKNPRGGFLTLWCEVEAVLEFDHESILPCTQVARFFDGWKQHPLDVKIWSYS